MKKLSLTCTIISLSVMLAGTFGIGSALAATPQYTKLNVKQGIRRHLLNGTSTNWGGYAVETNLANPQSGAVTNASGQWVVPTLTCSFRNTSYSASWVGIDGYSDNTVEQTGTGQDCSRGRPQYYAWFEFYPQYEYQINMNVQPGNLMSADVKYIGNSTFTLTLTNKTTNRIFTISSVVPGAQLQSAEWIEEAPSSWFGVLPLANFGTANFSNASATINGVTGPISNPSSSAWQYDPVTMLVSTQGPAKALLSPLSKDGASFSVTWQHN